MLQLVKAFGIQELKSREDNTITTKETLISKI